MRPSVGAQGLVGLPVPAFGVQDLRPHLGQALDRIRAERLASLHAVKGGEVASRVRQPAEPGEGDRPLRQHPVRQVFGALQVQAEGSDAREHLGRRIARLGDGGAEFIVPGELGRKARGQRQPVVGGVERLGEFLATDLCGQARHVPDAVVVRPRIAAMAELELGAPEGRGAAVEVLQLHQRQAFDLPDARARGGVAGIDRQGVRVGQQAQGLGGLAAAGQDIGLDDHGVLAHQPVAAVTDRGPHAVLGGEIALVVAAPEHVQVGDPHVASVVGLQCLRPQDAVPVVETAEVGLVEHQPGDVFQAFQAVRPVGCRRLPCRIARDRRNSHGTPAARRLRPHAPASTSAPRQRPAGPGTRRPARVRRTRSPQGEAASFQPRPCGTNATALSPGSRSTRAGNAPQRPSAGNNRLGCVCDDLTAPARL